MEINDLTIGFIGSGGDGVVSAGEILVSSAASEGLYCFMTKSFGPQIRGGESSSQVRISTEQVLSQGDFLDALVVFNWKDFKRFASEVGLKDNMIIFYEEDDPASDDELPVPKNIKINFFKVPFIKLSKENIGSILGKNIVSLGIVSELFNISIEGIKKGILSRFKKKGDEIIDRNLKAFEAGREYVKQIKERDKFPRLKYEKTDSKMVIAGNDALAYGALYAGCKFFAGYPITPSSEIMEILSRELPKFGGVFVQTEDEIAAATMVIGASFGGVKSMTATSGPGISLMCETIGLSAIAEIPSVFVNVQRVGPSTGIPTKSEQADLQQALYGTHGAAPRVVIAPADVEDCFDCAVEAFNIAEKYQVPVLILSDQFIGQRIESIRKINLKRFKIENRKIAAEDEIKDGYMRFKKTKSGVSPITHPGIKGGQYLTSGIEHDERGYPTSQYDIHEEMNEKRFKKYLGIRTDLRFIRRYGPEDAEIGVIGWGSSKGAIKEAVLKANEEGYHISALIPQILYPLPYQQFDEFLKPLKKIIVVELSYSGQFYKYLRSHFNLPLDTFLLKRSGAKLLSVDEIFKTIKEVWEIWKIDLRLRTTRETLSQSGVPDVETMVL